MLDCLLCRKQNTNLDFDNIETCLAPTTGKPIKDVLTNFLESIEIQLNTESYAFICMDCFAELSEFDDCMHKLQTVKKRLSEIIERTHNGNTILYYNKGDSILSYDTSEHYSEQATMDEKEISIPHVAIKMEDEEGEVIEEQQVSSDSQIDEQMPCTQCGKVFKNEIRLLRHIHKDHVYRKSVTCSVCGLSLKDEEYLDLHMNLHNGKTENECRYCLKKYTRKMNVIRHMQKHWNKKKFQCEKCGLRFSETTVLYNHKLQHEAEETPLICAICNQSCKTKRTYKGHMMTHRADRPRYNCPHCTKTFVEKYTLKVHQRTHECHDNAALSNKKKESIVAAEDNKACIICGEEFASDDEHNKHMRNEHDVILKL